MPSITEEHKKGGGIQRTSVTQVEAVRVACVVLNKERVGAHSAPE
jgi:hypothetical protein